MNPSTLARTQFAHTFGLFCGLTGVVMCLMPAVGCVISDGKGIADTPTSVKSFTQTDNGKTVTVDEADSFEVTLESNASTGYEWNIATLEAAALESEGDPKYVSPAGGSPGTLGQQVFRFKAKRVSKTTLVLHYARTWEKDKEPAEIFTLKVTVNKAHE